MSTVEEEPIQELILPGVVGETGFRDSGRSVVRDAVDSDEGIQSDDEDLDDVEETISERLYGLTEMLPPKVWNVISRSSNFSYWLLRRSSWVIGTSLALLVLPPFIEQQRLEFEEMQNMQRKQMMLGQGASMPHQPITLPPAQR